jgi:hypothetical protein
LGYRGEINRVSMATIRKIVNREFFRLFTGLFDK